MSPGMPGRGSAGAAHLDALVLALGALRTEAPRLTRWGEFLAARLAAGARLLTAGNGGSAAEAQHLSAELVGRFCRDRRPYSAIALHADTSSLTAIGNDYGYDQVFARQVYGHGRRGDVVVLLSASGCSANLLAAAEAAREVGATSWAFTGPPPNPLAAAVDEALCVPGSTATIQEAHLVAVHMLCAAFDAAVRPDAMRAPAMRASGMRASGMRAAEPALGADDTAAGMDVDMPVDPAPDAAAGEEVPA